MNAAITLVSSAPANTSTRLPAQVVRAQALVGDVRLDEGLAPGRDRGADGADDRQPVRPATTTAAGGSGSTRPAPSPASPATAEKTYAPETSDAHARRTGTARGCRSPSAMNPTTTTAATAALIWGGTPKIPRADPMPANSATMEPRFAASIRSAANTVQRTPQRSRMRLISPLPGGEAQPCADLLGEEQHDLAGEDHPQQGVAEVRAGQRVGGDAAGVVVGEPADEARAQDGERRDQADAPLRQPRERAERRRGRRRRAALARIRRVAASGRVAEADHAATPAG